MGTYVEIDGLNTWYDEQGSGEPLVLLHGGLCTNETWGAQIPVFAERFRVLAPERRGHGHTADVEGPWTYAAMATDTVGFLDEVVLDAPAHLVGWSDGGIVGLLVAIARPDLVASLYEQHSPDGAGHWPVVFGKFIEMVQREPHIPTGDLARIASPTLVLVGDDDLVSLEHTVALFRAVPDAELAVIPGTSHAVVMEKPEIVNRLVLDFLEKEPVPTMLPLRRAQP
jgi:pimeloyl-ACP methyl ester carboxylesterase